MHLDLYLYEKTLEISWVHNTLIWRHKCDWFPTYYILFHEDHIFLVSRTFGTREQSLFWSCTMMIVRPYGCVGWMGVEQGWGGGGRGGLGGCVACVFQMLLMQCSWLFQASFRDVLDATLLIFSGKSWHADSWLVGYLCAQVWIRWTLQCFALCSIRDCLKRQGQNKNFQRASAR